MPEPSLPASVGLGVGRAVASVEGGGEGECSVGLSDCNAGEEGCAVGDGVGFADGRSVGWGGVDCACDGSEVGGAVGGGVGRRVVGRDVVGLSVV